MFDLLLDPNTWIAFATLTLMEVVLGVDNVIFISVLVSKLPKAQADRARTIGLSLALIFRIALLLVLSWIIALSQPVFTAFGHGFSWRDIILLAGGLFLIYKAVHEMHAEIEEPHEPILQQQAKAMMSAIVTQIILLDLVFSIDSIITAIGMAQHVEVMIAAVIVAVVLMFVASGPIASFVARHPTTKMLALAFLVLIGVSLVADGLGFHIDKGYIYAAMGFAVLVEGINIFSKQRKLAAAAGTAPKPVRAAAAGAVPVETLTEPGKPKPRSTPNRRAQSRPKSAPRKKP
ncbi:MAG: TerC family protein [Devosia sp.]|jgi:predicted tellurium resistance membrane protein TerC|nr:TerC family protein [Devosia sp.]